MSSLNVHCLKWQKVSDKPQWSGWSASRREPTSERFEAVIKHEGKAKATRASPVLWHHLLSIYTGENGLPVVLGIFKKTPQLLHTFKNINGPRKWLGCWGHFLDGFANFICRQFQGKCKETGNWIWIVLGSRGMWTPCIPPRVQGGTFET